MYTGIYSCGRSTFRLPLSLSRLQRLYVERDTELVHSRGLLPALLPDPLGPQLRPPTTPLWTYVV